MMQRNEKKSDQQKWLLNGLKEPITKIPTWKQSAELSERQPPNDGPEDKGPDDDDAVGGQHCPALQNDERPVAQRVEGEAARAAEVHDRRGTRRNKGHGTWNWKEVCSF